MGRRGGPAHGAGDGAAKTELADKKTCAICTMGQGLSGQLDELMLYSAGFSSCGPIVMFNSYGRVGGLFHFAAGSLDEQAGALRRMLKDVDPSELYIPKRDELTLGTWDGMMSRDAHREESGQPPDDGEVLEDFFKNTCGFKRPLKTAPRGERYYVTINASGSLIISPGLAPGPIGEVVDYTNTPHPKIPSDAQIAMSTVILYGKNMYKT